MKLILNAPMIADSLGKAFGVIGQTGNEIAGFVGDLVANMPFRLDHSDKLEVLPFGSISKPIEIRDGDITTYFYASMITIDGLVAIVGDVFEITLARIFK